jgi:hypothetical protein
MKCPIHHNVELFEEKRPLMANSGYCNLCRKTYDLQQRTVISDENYPDTLVDGNVEIRLFVYSILLAIINLGSILFASGLYFALFGFPFIEIFRYKSPKDLNQFDIYIIKKIDFYDYIIKNRFLQINLRMLLYLIFGGILFLLILVFCTLLNILELFWLVYISLLGLLIIFRISEYKGIGGW